MKKILTAKQWVDNYFAKQITGSESYPDVYASKEGVVQSHIIFAKMHVQAALEVAANEAITEFIPFTDEERVNKDSILKAYPLTNIK